MNPLPLKSRVADFIPRRDALACDCEPLVLENGRRTLVLATLNSFVTVSVFEASAKPWYARGEELAFAVAINGPAHLQAASQPLVGYVLELDNTAFPLQPGDATRVSDWLAQAYAGEVAAA